MEFNKQTVKALLGVVCGGIAFAAALLHLDVVAGARPGGCWAFCPRCCWAAPSPLSSMSPCGRWSAACFPMQKKPISSAALWRCCSLLRQSPPCWRWREW